MWSQLSVPVRQNFNDNRKQMAEANIKMLQEVNNDNLIKLYYLVNRQFKFFSN